MSNIAPLSPDNQTSEQSTNNALSIEPPEAYQLDLQIGYLLRLANQRHLEIFSGLMPHLTPTQFSVLIRLDEVGELSQNELGRSVGIDAATTNGVVERLTRKELISSRVDTKDKRRLRISLTNKGRKTAREATRAALDITQQTVQNLSAKEAQQLTRLLLKLQA